MTDINNTSCASEFVRRCKNAGIKPILGIDFREKGEPLYIGLARNNHGFYQLNKFLSDHSMKQKALPAVPPDLPDTFFIYTALRKSIQSFRKNEFLGIRPDQVNDLFFSELRHYQHKLVILNTVTFEHKDHLELHKLLRCVDLNIILSKLEEKEHAKANDRFVTPQTLKQLFDAFPKVIKNTERLTAACSIDFKTGVHLNRQSFTGCKEGDFKLVKKLALNGCKKRYGNNHKQATERVQKELGVIQKQDFCTYFLITWDIIRYARLSGYHHVGRGSGANSIVAYCMGITDVDPLELDLYFERFINPYRTSPPDFDIDFSWDERDDVIDYILKRYGSAHTALLATYNTFKGRSIIRELGKVFGLPKIEIDALIANPKGEHHHHEISQKIFKFSALMEGFPNYLSIHAGGIVVSEEPIYKHTALQLMPKGFPITHFDMHHAEDLGFHKYDVLSQRGLGHIKDAVELIKSNQGKAVDIYDVIRIKADENVRDQLRSGNCIGCFYIESPAMRGLLKKLNCDNYIHLVAASSIIRPGVAKSGMMREYINRFHHPNSFKYLHPVFEEHLGETFGVMVYQEDVMKILHHFAGLDLDESDVLRRIMSGKKYKGDTFEHLKRKYFDHCKKRAYPDALAKEVWRQVESFSGYSFCKAHSASFAVESFQSLYLKAYFPLEFMVAVINNFGGFYRTEYYFHEARMQGAQIHAPCVNQSFYLTSINGKGIHIGFIHLAKMEQRVAMEIVHRRGIDGPFRSLEDFIRRVDITGDQLEILIRIGAFRFTGKNKYELMWEKNAVFNPKKNFDPTPSLFQEVEESYQLPKLREGPFDQAFDEIELLGFPLCSPFKLLAGKSCVVCISASVFKFYVGKTVTILGYYVCRKDVRTVKGKLMHFGTWIDEEGFFFDTVHFPSSLQKAPFTGKGVYKIKGRVVEDFGFPSVEVISMERLPFVKDERFEE